MRKFVAALACTAMAMVTFGATARAETSQHSSTGADAFWSTSQQVKGGFRIESWSISAFRSTDFSEASLFHDVVRCKKLAEPVPAAREWMRSRQNRHGKGKTPRRQGGCVTELGQSGFGTIAPGEFTVDQDLMRATLDFTLDLTSFSKKGEVKGDAVSTRVVADWTGTGSPDGTAFSDGTFNFRRGTCSTSESFEDAFRDAAAQATVGETSLGAANGGFINESSSTRTTVGDCPEEDPVPLGGR